MELGRKLDAPLLEGLFEAIKGLMEETNLSRFGQSVTSRWERVNFFIQKTMKECIIDVELVNRPRIGYGNGEEHVDNNELYHRRKTVKIVDACNLIIPFGDKASLISIDSAVRMKFRLENPRTTNGSCPKGEISDIQTVVGLQSLNILLHFLAPFGKGAGLFI